MSHERTIRMRNARHFRRGRSLVLVAIVTVLAIVVAGTVGMRLFGVRDPNNTLSIAEFRQQFPQLAEAAAGNGPAIVVVSVKPSDRTHMRATDPYFVDAESILVNPMGVPIWHHGYPVDSSRPPGEISPFYTHASKKADVWKDGFMGWCGTGMADLQVWPKQAGRFIARLPMESTPAKVGLHCFWNDAEGKKVAMTVWSKEFIADGR
jgi:hypothetical protein